MAIVGRSSASVFTHALALTTHSAIPAPLCARLLLCSKVQQEGDEALNEAQALSQQAEARLAEAAEKQQDAEAWLAAAQEQEAAAAERIAAAEARAAAAEDEAARCMCAAAAGPPQQQSCRRGCQWQLLRQSQWVSLSSSKTDAPDSCLLPAKLHHAGPVRRTISGASSLR